ncbi:MAG: helix-turn-helix transcriptional regulator [bacterium]|nr:helix-turn-helix transcriptional regulator [bacterium]
MEQGRQRGLRNPEKNKALLALVRKARKSAGVRQVDLAAALGQPQPSVSKYESGERRLDLPELYEVCLALGISLTEFVERFERTIAPPRENRQRGGGTAGKKGKRS